MGKKTDGMEEDTYAVEMRCGGVRGRMAWPEAGTRKSAELALRCEGMRFQGQVPFRDSVQEPRIKANRDLSSVEGCFT